MTVFWLGMIYDDRGTNLIVLEVGLIGQYGRSTARVALFILKAVPQLIDRSGNKYVQVRESTFLSRGAGFSRESRARYEANTAWGQGPA